MRFVSARVAGSDATCLLEPHGALRGLRSGDRFYPGTLSSLIRRGPEALAEAEAVLARGEHFDPAEVSYLPPVQDAAKIICVGLNYVDHAAESGFEPPNYPAMFSRFNSSLIGHLAPAIKPRVSEALDYEAELVAVIGVGGREIPEASALDHVIGYSVFNDISVRDYQMKSTQWMIGKNFDGTGAFGPALVTADELPAGANGLHIEARLNGTVLQSASTADMIFDVAKLVALISTAMTLEAGDIIVTGTPSGVGMARKPPLWMQAGDLCEIEIEGVGLLQNRIVAAS